MLLSISNRFNDDNDLKLSGSQFQIWLALQDFEFSTYLSKVGT